MNWLAIITIIGSYLLGSILPGYLAGKKSKGKDITKLGSGTPGAANIWQTVSRSLAIVAFLIDIVKGAIPPLVSQQLNLGLSVQMASGLAAVAGHNWSVFLRFRGGRGIATLIGLLLVLAPKELAFCFIVALIGAPFHNVALSVLIAVISLPFLSWWWGREQTIIAGGCIILLLVIAKRLEANQFFKIPAGKWWQVLSYRLLLDRDIKDRKAWIAGRGQE